MPKSSRTQPSQSRKVRRPAVKFYRGEWLHPEPRANGPDPEDADAVRGWLETLARPWAVDIFSGAGGLSLGLKQAGLSIAVAADDDKAALETHTANLGGLGYLGDLSDATDFLAQLKTWGITDVEVVAGGPPCQPFSRAGSSKIRDLVRAGVRPSQDPRTKLWWTFLDVIDGLSPRVVLFENVPDLASWDDGAVLIELLSSLRERGFNTDARILEAYRYGVPQHRTRLFVVGTRDGEFRWPDPDSEDVCLRDAISDLPAVKPAQRSLTLPYAGPKTPLQQRLRQGLQPTELAVIYDHVTRDVRPDDAEAFALLRQGQTYKDLPARLQRYRSDIFDDKYKRLAWKEVSRTITAHIAKDGYWYIHPSQNRTLSIREAARIQTFPDWFRFAGHPSFQYKQIGNAVPPLLAEAMGRSVVDFLRGEVTGELATAGFRTGLLRWHRRHSTNCPWRLKGASAWEVLLGELVLPRVDVAQRARLFKELKALAPNPRRAAAGWRELRSWGRRTGFDTGVQKVLEVARALNRSYAGRLPDDDLLLRSLPGVGIRTASAVRTFGFSRTTTLLSAGSRRLVRRVTGRAHLHGWQYQLEVLKLAGHVGPDAAFTEALADFTSQVCRTQDPKCLECPVRTQCATYRLCRPEVVENAI